MMKYNNRRKRQKAHATLKSATPAFRAFEELYKTTELIKELAKNERQNPGSLVEITKLMVQAYIIAHIMKALI